MDKTRTEALLQRLRAIQAKILAAQPPPQAASVSTPYTGHTV